MGSEMLVTAKVYPAHVLGVSSLGSGCWRGGPCSSAHPQGTLYGRASHLSARCGAMRPSSQVPSVKPFCSQQCRQEEAAWVVASKEGAGDHPSACTALLSPGQELSFHVRPRCPGPGTQRMGGEILGSPPAQGPEPRVTEPGWDLMGIPSGQLAPQNASIISAKCARPQGAHRTSQGVEGKMPDTSKLATASVCKV